MQRYVRNHSMEGLEAAVYEAIDGKDNGAALEEAWRGIKVKPVCV